MRAVWPALALLLIGAPAEAQDGGLTSTSAAQTTATSTQAAVDRNVATLRARHQTIKTTLDELVRRDDRRTADRTAAHRTHQASLAKTQALILGRARATETATIADRYTALSERLIWTLDRLDHELRAPPHPSLAVSIDLDPPKVTLRSSDAEQDAIRQVQSVLRGLRAHQDRAAARHLHQRKQRSSLWLAHCKALRDERVWAYAQLPKTSRAEQRGLSALGWANARLEIRYLESYARGRWFLRSAALAEIRPQQWNLRSAQAWAITQVILLIVVAFWLNRRMRGLRTWLRRYNVISNHSLGWHRRVTQVERHLTPIVPPALTLGVLALAYEILRPFDPTGTFALIYLLLWWLGAYWLLRTILSVIILWAVGRNPSHRTAATRRLVQWTSTTAAGTGFAFGLVHDVLVLILGRTVLYFYAQGAVYAVLVVVTLWVVQRWRSAIADAYLRTWPAGRLARLVENSRHRYYGFFVAVFAVALVLTSSLVTLTKNFLMGFDQARKALAFIFRKRLERRAEEVGGYKGKFDDLPKTLRRAFSTEPVLNSDARIDRFAGLPDLLEAVQTWMRTSEGGSFLLRADRGFGKSTWTRRAVELLCEEINATRVGLQRGTGCLAEQLAATLNLDIDSAPALKKVQSALQQGEKRLIVLEDVHRLFFRRLGGYQGVDDLIRLLHATRHHVFWVLTTDEQAWRFTQATRPDAPKCRHEYRLRPWSEDEIAHLLMARAAASGIAHHFEDLVVDDESAPSEAVLARTSAAYTRLIWDYADGCPMVAVHFWLRSLIPLSSTRVRVRLFRAPDESILQKLPNSWVFMLGAIAQHETLSPQEAGTVLGVSETTCTAAFEQCREQGLLDKRGNTLQYQISVYWYRSVERFLRERHLI